MQRNILIVAADSGIREALARELRGQGCTVTMAASGGEARRVVQTVAVDSVLIESHLADVPAEELRSAVLQIRPDCRVVLLSSFKLVRNSPELLRFGTADFLLRGEQVFELLRAGQAVAGGVSPTERGLQALIHVIDVLVGLLELENGSFGGSSHQVMQLSGATAQELGVDEGLRYEVVLTALLRNVARAGADASEAAADQDGPHQRDQTTASVRLLEHIDFPWKLVPALRHMYERYDGSGKPDGLRGREIPMAARVVAVVDAYVALTSRRSAESLAPELALQELVRGAGHRFDPEVVEAFHRVIDKWLTGRTSHSRPCVLLVDPDRQFRRMLRLRLQDAGLEVVEVDHHDRALKTMLESPPELVLVDLDSDPTGVFQTLQEMQQDPTLCRMPIAFLSQRRDRLLRLRALRQGVDDFLDKREDVEELVARIENILIREAIRANGETRRGRRGITGELENLSLPEIVQTLAIGQKTACVSVQSDGRAGQIWFENGAPRHATADALEGETAFYEMVRWTSGEFVIEHGQRTKQSSLSQDAIFLLMEGLRLMDEAASDGAKAAS